MAKRRSFEELLETEFRWPRQGDKPFVVAENPIDNATVATDQFARLYFMMEGYKIAADIMVKEAEADRTKRDFLVFPIIFNYRQFIELSLKYHIDTYGPSVGIVPNWNSHELQILWEQFLEVLDLYGSDDPDEVDPVVGEVILAFAKIDPRSYTYRYPVDTQGRPLPIACAVLHLGTLSDVMSAVAGYFSGCDGYLSSLLNACGGADSYS